MNNQMYNSTMETTKPEIGYVIEPLLKPEITRLKKMVLGYGNFKKTAIKMDIPVTTLRDVINKGYAEPSTIEKIRKVLEPDALAEKE